MAIFKSRNGYLVATDWQGNLHSWHVLKWQALHWPLPPGWHVHHVDKNPLNNSKHNLFACDPATHKRLDMGWWQVNGEWWKPCRFCDYSGPEQSFPIADNRKGERKTRAVCYNCYSAQRKLRRRKKPASSS